MKMRKEVIHSKRVKTTLFAAAKSVVFRDAFWLCLTWVFKI